MNSHAILNTNMRLLWIARHAAGSEDVQHGPTIALLFSSCWLESYVNDIYETLSWNAERGTPLPAKLQTLNAVGIELEARRAQLPEKIHILSAILRGHGFKRSARPYQDFDLLLAIRHRLVHARPYRINFTPDSDAFEVIGEPKKIRQGLQDRGILNRQQDSRLPWDIALMRPSLGEWSVQTAYEMAYAIAECFPRGKWRRWAHELNPVSPQAVRAMKRAKPVRRQGANF